MIYTLGVIAQLAIVAHAPDTVYACDAFDVSVAISASGGMLPRVTTPHFGPFDVLRASAPHVTSSGAGFMAEHRYTVATDRVGRYVLSPFEVRLGESRATSQPLDVVVLPPRSRAIPTVFARARIDTSADPSVAAYSVAETLYVGQQATYEVAVFLNQAARDRLRRNPTFYPPEMQAVLAYDMPLSAMSTRKRTSSQCFDALVYRRALFPIVSGRLAIPPAQLVYSTGLPSSSLFSREESHELQTDSIAMIVLEPPRADRPAEFTGAVGDIRLEAPPDSALWRVGDPALLTLRVVGSGNVKLFPRPTLGAPWAGIVPADERVRIDSTNPRISGVKEFDWVLTPRIAGEFDVPAIHYGYFDPSQRRYRVAESPFAGQRVHVSAGLLASADTGHAESALSIRTAYTGPASQPLHTRPAFWLVMALVPIPAIVSRTRRRNIVRHAPTLLDDPAKSLRSAAALTDPVTLRRYYVKALALRLGCNPEDFTHVGALERTLRRAGASAETAARAERILRQLDAAAYASAGPLPPEATRDASAILGTVDSEALSRRELPFWVPLVIVAVGLSLAGAAIAADSAQVQFARGVSSYLRQDYVTAREAFGAAATTAPAAADAWANYGTASWTVGDTAAAVYGWRQALALEPYAEDLQDRASAVRDVGPTAPGYVPGIPRDLGTWLFAALWLGGWALAWLVTRSFDRPVWLERAAMPMIVIAVLIGLSSIELQTRISGSRLAVVRGTVSLTMDPAIGMDRGPTIGTGEIVRVMGRRGAWTRVSAGDDRDGWVASSRLLFIADKRVPRE